MASIISLFLSFAQTIKHRDGMAMGLIIAKMIMTADDGNHIYHKLLISQKCGGDCNTQIVIQMRTITE